jgi:hypothetical protein
MTWSLNMNHTDRDRGTRLLEIPEFPGSDLEIEACAF